MMRTDYIWLATESMDVLAGTETALAQVKFIDCITVTLLRGIVISYRWG